MGACSGVRTGKRMAVDVLHGEVKRNIILFALPLAASSILQQLFNAADVAVVGRFAGSGALAAVGANGSVINLLVNLFVGLSVGANAVISSLIGQKNDKDVRRSVHTSVMVAVISGCILLILGQIMAGLVLKWMSTPADIIEAAERYFRIYFLGMPFIMLYNFSAAILRSSGDTKRPLIALSISGVVNVLLNLFFVIVCGMGVSGVAVATVLSNVVSSGILVYILFHETGKLKLELRLLRIDKKLLMRIARIGLPAGLQGVVFSLSNVCIQSALNELGSEYVAGSTAGLNFEFIVYFVVNAFNQTAVTMIGQNYGARNFKRCRQVTCWAFVLGAAATVVVSLTFLFTRGYGVKIFTGDETVAAIACMRLSLVLPFELLNLVIEVLSGTMRGMGHSLVPAAVSVLGICGVRILYLYTFYPSIAGFHSLILVYPVSWAVTAATLFMIYMISVRKKLRQL